MEADGQTSLNDGGLHQLHQIGVVGIGPGALGDLENQRGIDLFSGLRNSLNDFHVVDVEGADGVAAIVGFLEHFGSSNQWHTYQLLFLKIYVKILSVSLKKSKGNPHLSQGKTDKKKS